MRTRKEEEIGKVGSVAGTGPRSSPGDLHTDHFRPLTCEGIIGCCFAWGDPSVDKTRADTRRGNKATWKEREGRVSTGFAWKPLNPLPGLSTYIAPVLCNGWFGGEFWCKCRYVCTHQILSG
jgi:hypothetical protein